MEIAGAILFAIPVDFSFRQHFAELFDVVFGRARVAEVQRL